MDASKLVIRMSLHDMKSNFCQRYLHNPVYSNNSTYGFQSATPRSHNQCSSSEMPPLTYMSNNKLSNWHNAMRSIHVSLLLLSMYTRILHDGIKCHTQKHTYLQPWNPRDRLNIVFCNFLMLRFIGFLSDTNICYWFLLLFNLTYYQFL